MLAQIIPFPEPRSLGRYRITGVLGRGAMGMVYQAFDPVIERTVAVKTVSLRLETDEVQPFKERFYREAKAAGGLNHPNIVTIYDVAEEDEVAYIAMEILEGLNLLQIIDSGSRPPIARAARIIAEVADALAYAHDRGVIHRDIKPANIILTRQGLTKITDFGIAQIPATSSSQPGLLIGSPRYMAPEQITGAPVDGRSDIFSLGAMLYELTTGQAPFQAENLGELMYRILNDTPRPPSQIVPAMPADLDALIGRALAKNPDDRFQNARDLARALRKFQASPLAGASRRKRWDGLTSGPVRTFRQHKSIAFLAMGVVVGGAFASVALSQFSPMPMDGLTTPLRTAAANMATVTVTPFSIPFHQIQDEARAIIAETPLPQPLAARATKAKPAATNSRVSELEERLKELRRELNDLKTRFTDLHPDVLATRRHIEKLEEEKRKHQSGYLEKSS